MKANLASHPASHVINTCLTKCQALTSPNLKMQQVAYSDKGVIIEHGCSDIGTVYIISNFFDCTKSLTARETVPKFYGNVFYKGILSPLTMLYTPKTYQ